VDGCKGKDLRVHHSLNPEAPAYHLCASHSSYSDLLNQEVEEYLAKFKKSVR
jgi:hypothetical protein